MDKVAENVSGYTWMVNTFQKVDGSVTKLSDFSIKENLNPTVAKLSLLDKDGATAKEESGKYCTYVYLNPAKATGTRVAGWYLDGTSSAAMTGPGSDGWRNDVEIPYGMGFGLNRGTTAATLVFSGAVANEDAEIVASNVSGYTWMGNVMPVDMTLADLSIKENLNPTVAKLSLLDKDDATAKEESGKYCTYVYLNPAKATGTRVADWYLDGTSSAAMTGPGSDGWRNDVEIKAGQAFGLNRGTTSATLIVPSPLVDHQAAE